MTRRETTIEAVAHRETAEVPYQILFLGPLQERVLQHFGGTDVNRAVGNYLNWGLPPATVGQVALPNGEFMDEWGVRWKETRIDRGYILEHPIKRPVLSEVTRPDLRPAERVAGLREACERDSDLYLIGWCGELFERAHFLRGMDNLMVDMVEEPQFVHGLLDVALEFCLESVDLLSQYPLDVIILSDDYGQQSGPLFSPRHFREFIKPRLTKLFARIRSRGKRAALHSCGNVTAFLPDLVEAGLEILHPVQAEVMDVHAVKKEFGRDLCLYGGINTQQLLRHGAPAQIRDTVRREKDLLSRGGGYILAPNLDLTHDFPLENALAFIEAAQA